MLLLALFAGYSVLRSYWRILGPRGSVISTIVLFGVLIPLLMWRALKSVPEGTGVTGEKSVLIGVPFERVVSAISPVLKLCRWNVVIADVERGYFKGKIPRSITTCYGQIFQVDVKGIDEASSEVRLRCEAYHQVVDYGQNNKMIDKFYSHLYQTCRPLETSAPSTTYHIAPAKVTATRQHKDAGFAALISGIGGIFTFGLGHFYVGRVGRGLALVVAGGLLKMGLGWVYYLRGGVGLVLIFGLLNVGVWIWQAYDAYALAKKYNTEVERTGKAPW